MAIEVLPVESGSMRTRDGVRIDADIYRPAVNGPWPVLLLRQAYGRRVAASVCYAHPRWYAAQGFVVVVQDVRGRGTSEGVFRTLEQEAEDGAEAIAWCAALHDTTGAVGMYGFSYQGMNQLLAAALAGPELKAIAPAMIGWNLRTDMLGDGEVPQLAGAIGWAAQVGADSAAHAGDAAAWNDLRRTAMAPPLDAPVAYRPDALERHAAYHHLYRWLDAGPHDTMWQAISPDARLKALAARGLPSLFVGGWYDFTLPGTLAAYTALHAARPDITRLVVGPWAHMPWNRTLGGHDFGPEAVSDIDRRQVTWFNQWLKGDPAPADAPVRLFDIGQRQWRDLAELPTETATLYLTGDGRASVDQASGLLRATPALPSSETLVHDPWRAAPTCGGRYGSPPGPVDRRAIDERGDVLTFTSAPLAAPMSIAGRLSAQLHVEADAPSFDLHATLSVVGNDGAVRPFAEGACRIGHSPAVATLDLKAACITLLPGESLRLSVAGASYPAFALNDGSGKGPYVPQHAARIITIILRTGKAAPSALHLAQAPSEPRP